MMILYDHFMYHHLVDLLDIKTAVLVMNVMYITLVEAVLFLYITKEQLKVAAPNIVNAVVRSMVYLLVLIVISKIGQAFIVAYPVVVAQVIIGILLFSLFRVLAIFKRLRSKLVNVVFIIYLLLLLYKVFYHAHPGVKFYMYGYEYCLFYTLVLTLLLFNKQVRNLIEKFM